MRRLILVLLVITLLPANAQTKKRTTKAKTPSTRTSIPTGTDRDLADALTLAKAGRYAEASQRLFQLSYSPRFRDKRMQIKYILGMTLHQMKLNQVSAFQFIGVVKEGNN